MGLIDQINDDIKTAMRARDKHTLEALRAIKAALLLEGTKAGASDEVPEDIANKMLQKLHKQRAEAAEIYRSQGREDLAGDEVAQAAVIEKYLPEAMSEDELKTALAEIISQVGATAPSDMGKVMGVASKQLAGKADGKTISELVKQLLS
jgi:uncharacterized protein YqeY